MNVASFSAVHDLSMNEELVMETLTLRQISHAACIVSSRRGAIIAEMSCLQEFLRQLEIMQKPLKLPDFP